MNLASLAECEKITLQNAHIGLMVTSVRPKLNPREYQFIFGTVVSINTDEDPEITIEWDIPTQSRSRLIATYLFTNLEQYKIRIFELGSLGYQGDSDD